LDEVVVDLEALDEAMVPIAEVEEAVPMTEAASWIEALGEVYAQEPKKCHSVWFG
jgi:hypothetical protein